MVMVIMLLLNKKQNRTNDLTMKLHQNLNLNKVHAQLHLTWSAGFM